MDNMKKVENDLWDAADQLRANSKLTASEYSMPVLGLIFLRYAYNRFLMVKEEIEEKLPSRRRRNKGKKGNCISTFLLPLCRFKIKYIFIILK